MLHLLFILGTTFSAAVATTQLWVIQNPIKETRITNSTTKTQNIVQTKIDRLLDAPVEAYYCGLFGSALLGLDVFIRISASANLRGHLQSFLNWVDMFALAVCVLLTIVYERVSIHGEDFSAHAQSLLWLRCVCINLMLIRIFHAGKFCIGVRTLLLTFRASTRELATLFAFLLIGMSLYGNAVYQVEHSVPNSDFVNITTGYWWSIVTMTTVGYGDIYPRTTIGQILGGFCAITGLIVTSLAIPVLSQNFNFYYKNARMLEKRRQVMAKAKGITHLRTYTTIHSNDVFPLNLVQGFLGPPSPQNHANLRDEVFSSPKQGAPFRAI